jgi:hypothetical protein
MKRPGEPMERGIIADQSETNQCAPHQETRQDWGKRGQAPHLRTSPIGLVDGLQKNQQLPEKH